MAPKQKPGKSRQEMADAIRNKFWKSVDQSNGPTSCWPWLKGKCVGYGYVYLGGGRLSKAGEYAHRLALYYTTGILGEVAMHSCDNRICCNPMHLHWATHAENSQDARDKRREYIGEANSNAVLDDAKVVTIRRMQSRGCRLKDIAEVVGCSTSNVSKVARRELWIHVHA